MKFNDCVRAFNFFFVLRLQTNEPPPHQKNKTKPHSKYVQVVPAETGEFQVSDMSHVHCKDFTQK